MKTSVMLFSNGRWRICAASANDMNVKKRSHTLPSHAELETQLLNEPHEWPLEAIKTMLKLTLPLKIGQDPAPPQIRNLVDFMRNSPLTGVDLELTRDQSP